MAKTSTNAQLDHRLVVRDDGRDRHALLVSSTLRGYDLYIEGGPHWLWGRWISHSFHQSGQLHAKFVRPAGDPTMGTRQTSSRRIKLEQGRGVTHLLTDFGDLRRDAWTYTPKPNTARRKTTIIDRSLLPTPATLVQLYAVEPGRPDLLARQCADPFAGVGPVVAHDVIEGACQILAVVYGTPKGLRQDTLIDLEMKQRASRRASGRNRQCPCGSRRKFKLCCAGLFNGTSIPPQLTS
jgi:hypothetical protein